MLLWIFCYQIKPISMHRWYKSSCFLLITKCTEYEFRILLYTLLVILNWSSLLLFIFKSTGYINSPKYCPGVFFTKLIVCHAYSACNEPWKAPHNIPWIFSLIIYISHLKTWELLIPQHCGHCVKGFQLSLSLFTATCLALRWPQCLSSSRRAPVFPCVAKAMARTMQGRQNGVHSRKIGSKSVVLKSFYSAMLCGPVMVQEEDMFCLCGHRV